MGLIKGKNGIQKLLVGYPTVTDKYDVIAATLEGSTDCYNGDVMMRGSAHSLYKKAVGTSGSYITSANQIAGVLLATNVKVPSVYPADSASVATKAGEQFNLIIRGFVAVKLEDTNAVLANAVEGASVYITQEGKLTTVPTSTTSTNVLLPWKFTGVTELQGNDKVAEIVL